MENAAKVSSIPLCPRQLKMYVGELFNLVPLGLDSTQKAVHAVQKSWSSSTPAVAAVDLTGEVEAKGPGTATLTLTSGSKTATVAVQVLSGARPKQTDAEWDAEHAGDCDTPISSNRSDDEDKSVTASDHNDTNPASGNERERDGKLTLKSLARRAAYSPEGGSSKRPGYAVTKPVSTKPVAARAASRAPYYFSILSRRSIHK